LFIKVYATHKYINIKVHNLVRTFPNSRLKRAALNINNLAIKEKPVPNQIDIKRLYAICCEISDCTPESILVFVTAFVTYYEYDAFLIDRSLNPVFRLMIARQVGLSLKNLSRTLALAKCLYDVIPKFSRKVNFVVWEFYKEIRIPAIMESIFVY